MEDGTGPHMAPKNEPEIEEQHGEFAPHEQDGEAAADNVSEQTGDKASVDGRISSLPPNYEQDGDDPSADEARIQQGQRD